MVKLINIVSSYHQGLGKFEMFQLARNAVEFVFADDGVKKELREVFNSAEKRLD